jgi:hypothetical protein
MFRCYDHLQVEIYTSAEIITAELFFYTACYVDRKSIINKQANSFNNKSISITILCSLTELRAFKFSWKYAQASAYSIDLLTFGIITSTAGALFPLYGSWQESTLRGFLIKQISCHCYASK